MGTSMNTWHEVAPPPVTPNRYGLFSVAQMRTSTLEGGRTDEHWRMGVEWISQACGYTYTQTGVCATSGSPLFNDDGSDEYGFCTPERFDPFTVYAYNTDPLPGWTLEQQRQHAVERLIASEEREAEYQVLQQMQANINFSVDYSMNHAWYGLGAAENQYAWEYGAQPVIHMDSATAITLSMHLHAEGGVLRTITGTPVIVGKGYTQNPFPRTPYPVHKIYLTGPVIVYRSEINTQADAVNMGRNKASVVAQRDYVVGYDCRVMEIEVALDQPVIP